MVNRRWFLKAGAAAVTGGALAGTPLGRVARAVPTGPIAITHGTVTGDVTATSALVWARASAEGLMQVEYDRSTAPEPCSGPRHTRVQTLDSGSDFIGQFELDGLEPDSPY